jgi:hypothetical protein
MANPQPTDAHLRIAHSINEAIMLRDFTKRQRKILDLILRLSWGCGKKTANIPRQRDFMVIGIAESHISSELNWLTESQVIRVEGSYYSFNKDFDQWQVSRVKPFNPQKLTELVRLNLNHTYQNSKLAGDELTKTVSKDLPKQVVSTSQNSKFSTPNLAMPKEMLNKDIRKREDKNLEKEKVKITPRSQEMWEEAKASLQKQVSPLNFRTWLQNTVGVTQVGNTFIVGIHSESVAEYLAKNQRSLIERTLTELLKETVEVSFVLLNDNLCPVISKPGGNNRQ